MYIFSFCYVLLTAISMVLIHHAASMISPALNLFIGTMIAITFFHIVNYKHLKIMYLYAFRNKLLWIKMMLSVAGMWLATIYGPALISPDIYILLYFAFMCLLGISFSLFTYYDIRLIISGIGITICTLLLVKLYIAHMPITWNLLLGIALGLLGGAFQFIYSKQSYYFIQKTTMSVTQVLAIRFWLVEFTCLFLMTRDEVQQLNLHTSLLITIIAFASLILPIYFSVKSIASIGPEKSAMIFGLIPLATYTLHVMLSHHLEFYNFVLNGLTGCFIALPYLKHSLNIYNRKT